MDKKVSNALWMMIQSARSALLYRFKRHLHQARKVLGISMVGFTLALSACSTSTPTATIIPPLITAPSATPQPSPTAIPSPTASPADTNTPQQTNQPTTLDPCQLINSQDASTLANATYGDGVEGTVPGGGKTCTYGAQTTNVFFVEVVQAPDEASAEAAKNQFLSDLQANLPELNSQGLTVTQLPNFADGGIIGHANINSGGVSINGSAIGFRKGTVFFGFSDVVAGGKAPDDTSLQNEATTVLGLLP